MFQIVTAELLNELQIPLPVFDGVPALPADAVFVGNFGGTKDERRFFARDYFSKMGFESRGVFVGSPHIDSFRQVTEKLFVFRLKVYSKGYDQYNQMWVDCKAAGKTAQAIATITDPSQIISIQGSLQANHFTSAKTGVTYHELNVFVGNMNYCGVRGKAGNNSGYQNNSYPVAAKAVPVAPVNAIASYADDEIPF